MEDRNEILNIMVLMYYVADFLYNILQLGHDSEHLNLFYLILQHFILSTNYFELYIARDLIF